jgi:NAD(P)-dependent dehydrogenase (short-subunit alcohol dehydrogenase family)
MYTVPGQVGRLFIVTGASSGLGREAARRLAAAGAHVVLAVRAPAKGEQVREAILKESPGSAVEVRRLDLADLGSVKDFAEGMIADGTPLDALLNNAGVMTPPSRRTTADGFELQFGTNFLGHFALTLRLMPVLLAAAAPRVVTVSSLAARLATIKFDDLHHERGYRPAAAYGQSKLADLLFARRLAEVATGRGWKLMSNAAHPGYTRTNLIEAGAALREPGGRRTLMHVAAKIPHPVQHVEMGAEPLLYAMTSPDAVNGGYYGPKGPLELAGPAGPARFPRQARDAEVAGRLWAEAERLTSMQLPPE